MKETKTNKIIFCGGINMPTRTNKTETMDNQRKVILGDIGTIVNELQEYILKDKKAGVLKSIIGDSPAYMFLESLYEKKNEKNGLFPEERDLLEIAQQSIPRNEPIEKYIKKIPPIDIQEGMPLDLSELLCTVIKKINQLMDLLLLLVNSSKEKPKDT